MSKIQGLLPQGVKVEIGPDATGVGWVYQYALKDKTGRLSSYELRSLQDFKLKYLFSSVQGVAEVASIGGYRKQYQITIDPQKLINYDIPLSLVLEKVKQSNQESGARVIEIGGAEFMIRGRGYIRNLEDLSLISLKSNKDGTPILLKNIANITLGPDIRRGVSDLDGEGDTVGGIIVMRQGENPLDVIQRVKLKIQEINSFLPEGVELLPVYDRSELIKNSIAHFKEKVIEEVVIVSSVILIFLWHFPSAIIPIITIPISIVLAFLPLYLFNQGSNIMSISGIAISIGVLVDGAIVEVENAYKKLEEWDRNGRQKDYHKIRTEALLEVGPSVFFSLLVIGVSFIPIFALEEAEGRLFKPLAYSKNFTMVIAAILAITLDPAVRMLFTKVDPIVIPNFPLFSKIYNLLLIGKYYPEEQHPISKLLFKVYEPACKFTLKHSKATILLSIVLVLLTVPIYLSMGSEFIPYLYEESILYMPTTMPGISITETSELLKKMDEKIKSFPEVERVFGKAGRADTSTDSAPLSMFETVILLKDRKEWRKKERFYSSFPVWLQIPFKFFYPEEMTPNELIEMMNKELEIPGVSNSWTMPIKTRIDMLSTGMRTPLGIKVQGNDLNEIENISLTIESILKNVKGVGAVFAERSAGGYYLDIELKRDKLARYGITIKQVQEIILTAIGGEPISETIEGRERYSINVRYPKELRDSAEKLGRVLVPTVQETHSPLKEVAEISYKIGPSMIRDENGFLTGYIYVSLAPNERDIAGFVERAKKLVDANLNIPKGYIVSWSGNYESILRVKQRLKFIIPFPICIIIILIYLNTKSFVKTLIVLLAVPFSLIGGISLLYILDYQLSIAVWVGLIALMGLDAETGMFMLMYLEMSIKEAKENNAFNTPEEIDKAILHGAVQRIRPKMMTVFSAFIGLLPIVWSHGTGSDLMKTIALPMVGGLFTSFILELLIYPPLYKEVTLRKMNFLKAF